MLIGGRVSKTSLQFRTSPTANKQAEIQRNSKKTFIPRRVPHAYKTSIHWPWVHHGEWKSIYLYSNMGASNKQNLEEDDFQKFSKHLWKNTWPDDAIIVKEGKVFAENIQTNWFGGSGVMLYKIIKKHKILFLAKEGLPKYGNFWNTSAMFNRIFSNHDYS